MKAEQYYSNSTATNGFKSYNIPTNSHDEPTLTEPTAATSKYVLNDPQHEYDGDEA